MLSKEEMQRGRFVRQEMKKKNLSSFYKEFGVNHRAWLKELTDKYKSRGIYPLSPLVLSDYYKDPKDKMLATLVASLLLDDNDRTMQQVMDTKNLLGEHPYETFFSSRGFVLWSNGSQQTKTISYFGSTHYWQISKLFDIIWNIEQGRGKSLFEVFFEMITVYEYTPHHALLLLFENLPVSRPEWRINLALLRLCGADGISEHLWDIGGLERRLDCPNDIQTRKFMRNWIPEWQHMFSFEEVCMLLGFEKKTDMYYCHLAFRELSRCRMREVRQYLHLYSVHYNRRQLGCVNRCRLKNRQPRIEFQRLEECPP